MLSGRHRISLGISMNHLTCFDHDIFISYAHIDDTPIMEGESGWVTEFHKSLDALVRQILGDEPKIWRDPKLQGNDYFGDTLVDALPKTAVLVSIISPRYVKSEWCLKELQRFSSSAEKSGGIRVSDKSRIFKVMKTLVPQEHHPAPLDQLLGYEFYQVDPATGKPAEFRAEFGPEAKRNYLAKLYDLAYEITELLKQLQHPNDESSGSNTPIANQPVFLAETTSDLREERERVKSELRQLGYSILPDRQLSLDASDLQEMLEADLQRCALSIHIVGEKSGFTPEGEQRSVIRLQNDIAARYSKERGLKRLIWMTPDVMPKSERQQKFIHFLENDSEAQRGADVLRSSLEELKTIMQDRLKAGKALAANTIVDEEFTRIYLICDQCDIDAATALYDYLYNQGFEVLLPVFEGDESEVREDHTDKLVTSDAIIIYYGLAKELWLSSKLRDLRKLPGFDGYKPKLATAIYVAAPSTVQKERLRSREALVIKDLNTFSKESLAPFIEAIQARSREW